MTPEAVLALQNAGAQVLDAREPSEFAQAHMRDSINIGLGGHFATWAGTILDRTRAIVLIAEPTRETEAAMRLGRIGFDLVVGFLDGGIHALEDRDDLIQQTRRVSAEEAGSILATRPQPLVLDVRTPQEWQTTRIDPSVNIPLNHLIERVADVPRDRTARRSSARAATARRLPRACCSSAILPMSSNSPVAWQAGRRRERRFIHHTIADNQISRRPIAM